jgi:hypothetical protein
MRLALAVGITCAVAAAGRPSPSTGRVAVLKARCQECHRAGEIGDVVNVVRGKRPWASRLRPRWCRRRCLHGSPILRPAISKRPFAGQKEIETLVAWAGGAPEGDAKDAPRPLRSIEAGTSASRT